MGTVEPPGSTIAVKTESTPTYIGPRSPAYEHAASSLWVALVVNLVIGGIKFLAWLVSRSPSVLSEALHSLGDGVNSIALIVGNHLGKRPPDRTHPFGYGLEANLWTIPACVLLVVFSSIAIWEGWHRLTAGAHVEATAGVQLFGIYFHPYWFSASVLVVSIILETYAVRRASRAVLEEMGIQAEGFIEVYRQAFANIRHVVGPTTRFVFYEDAIAWLGAFLALVAVSVSYFAVQLGWLPPDYAHYPDAIVSILIGLMLIGMAIYLFKHNRGVLTQTAAPARVETRIMELVTSLNGVSEVLDLKTVDHGLAGLTVHLKVEVDPYTLVKDVDDLTERIKERIQRRIGNVSQVFVEVLADESEIEWGEKFNALVEQGHSEGVLNARDVLLLKNVYDFTDSTAADIMIPRTDVEAVELDTPLTEVADLIIETGHSKLPVYKEYMDDLVGLVHAREVFEKIRQGQLDTPLSEMVREIAIYPENKPIGDLLEDFKRNKVRIAAVADEHGGFAGLVTVEDVVEEIIGEIWDEHDEEEPMLAYLDSRKVQVNGRLDIEDINEQLDLNLPFDDFKTVGGYVFGALGREPEVGDEVMFEDIKFTVTEADGPRIVSVMIESPVPFMPEVEESRRIKGHEEGGPG
ncbi:MAG TPA: cation diffusion facilitator family transporter [Coleofasciculaceae cyanobacterium]